MRRWFARWRPVPENRLSQQNGSKRDACGQEYARDRTDRCQPYQRQPLQLLGTERDPLEDDGKRRNHPRREAVADVGVALHENSDGDHKDGDQQNAGGAAGEYGRHRIRPLRIKLITPSRTRVMTQISPNVSNPRKSARITVTMSLP